MQSCGEGNCLGHLASPHEDVNKACWCDCDRFSGVALHVIYLQAGVCSGGCSSQTFSDVVEVCDAWYKKWHAGLWVFAPKLFINARLPHEEGQSGDLGFSSVPSPTWCQRNACTPCSFNPLKRLAHIVGSRVGTRVLHVSEATSIPAVDHMPISHLPDSCKIYVSIPHSRHAQTAGFLTMCVLSGCACVLRWPGHFHHPEVAGRCVWLRSRDLHCRPGTGGSRKQWVPNQASICNPDPCSTLHCIELSFYGMGMVWYSAYDSVHWDGGAGLWAWKTEHGKLINRGSEDQDRTKWRRIWLMSSMSWTADGGGCGIQSDSSLISSLG